MKRKPWIKRAAAIGLVACSLLLSSCDGGKQPGTSPTPTGGQSQDQLLSFVAADKSNWDKEINIGDYSYTLAVNFKDGGSLELTATCTGAAQVQQQQQGGPGIPGVNNSQGESEPTPAPTEMTATEKAAQNFTKTGSWELEAGYGYTVTIDGYTTKTNYDKASARHIFYAEIKNGGASSGLVQFQGKDTGFRSGIAADYQDFELRDAAYIFEEVDTSGNNNPNATHLYLEKDGSANALTYQGSTPTYKRGSWTENADKSLTVTINGENTGVDYCDIPGKEGYRVTYNSSTMYATVSGAAANYTDADFNGATLKTLQCAEGDYTIQLTEKGFAVVYKNGESDTTGKYTQSGDTLTIVLDGDTFVSQGNSITVEMPAAGSGGSSGGDPETRTFALDGSVPQGGGAPEGGAPAGGDGGSAGNPEGGDGGSAGNPEGGAPEGGAPEGGDGGSAGNPEGGDGGSAGAPQG